MKSPTQSATGKSKYIFITGGVLSSLGKGISSASLGYLLQKRGYSVTIQKFDPYLNVDPGTMSPLQHGEVFVTDDGAETDLDLGHYERFLAYSLHKNNTHSAGQVYFEVITKERKGSYLGKTVQVVPHITNEIKRRMRIYEGQYDFILIEIGGTVGDIESMPFLETQRQINYELSSQDVLNIHLTYVPYLHSSQELKTKPTQHSVRTLMEYGIRPDVLLCRTEVKLNKEIRQKIGLFCNVNEEAVIEVADAENTIYEVPLLFKKNALDEIVLRKLNMPLNDIDMDEWQRFVNRIKKPANEVTVGLIGKYTKYEDSYKSIYEAFIHSGSINNAKVKVELINSEELTSECLAEKLGHLHGILVGPGFGNRGIEGKILAAQYAREKKIPFFGICLGMQCACIEFARNVCGIANAHTRECEEEGIVNEFVIDLMETQRDIKEKGGTMRLGAYPCKLDSNSLAYAAYKSEEISERHRHRYEFNNDYIDIFKENGINFSGTSPNGKLVEIVELKEHPWFVGVQFHPELKSRAVTGHPLFINFIKATLQYRKVYENV
ncbi:MAG: CTP synthase [Ignavibacteria bacterium]|jgi:CTP synthase|nr:CTP synthase [Ignavibacteria bacterium]